MCRCIFIYVVFLSFSLVCQSLSADEPLSRYGTVIETHNGIKVESGMTVTAQHGTNSQTQDELLASFDLLSLIPFQAGEWAIYVEGNTTPKPGGVSSTLVEANADAGSALDRDGKGRLQVSEFYYRRPLMGNSLAVGLLDPAGVLDGSDVANDETAQFLGASFVNNPTIAMPDYTLGAGYHIESKHNGVEFSLLLTGSHGLADSPNASYAELVELDADGKGLFVGGEVYWPLRHTIWRIGVWLNTAKFDYLDDSGNSDKNYGVYLSTDYAINERYRLNVRAGLANETVSIAADFLGIALETRLAGYMTGIGIAHTGVSSKAGAGYADFAQAEIYTRFHIHDQLQLTPSLQWIQNSGFRKPDTNADSNPVGVFSLRASYVFL